MTDQIKYTSKLTGKHVLIIGGSSGIGYGVAEASLEHGARVTISSSNPARLSAAAARLRAAYPSASDRIATAACDLGTEATLEANLAALFATAAGAHGLDHVVYTAGDPLAMTSLQDATLASIKQAGTVRFFASLLAAREAAKYLPRSADASFTLTSGAVAERPLPGRSVVGSYAAGHFSMTRGLALDLKPVRVNCVSPGAVDTELWRKLVDDKEKVFEGMRAGLPVGRVGRVEDVAEAYLYLMKDGFVTGSVVSTNGGALLV